MPGSGTARVSTRLSRSRPNQQASHCSQTEVVRYYLPQKGCSSSDSFYGRLPHGSVIALGLCSLSNPTHAPNTFNLVVQAGSDPNGFGRTLPLRVVFCQASRIFEFCTEAQQAWRHILSNWAYCDSARQFIGLLFENALSCGSSCFAIFRWISYSVLGFWG